MGRERETDRQTDRERESERKEEIERERYRNTDRLKQGKTESMCFPPGGRIRAGINTGRSQSS